MENHFNRSFQRKKVKRNGVQVEKLSAALSRIQVFTHVNCDRDSREKPSHVFVYENNFNLPSNKTENANSVVKFNYQRQVSVFFFFFWLFSSSLFHLQPTMTCSLVKNICFHKNNSLKKFLFPK